MTVAAQNPVASYTANGITTDFTLAAKVLTSTDLKVYLNGVLQSSGYTVSGIGDSGGVTVAFSSPPASGVNVVLHRELPVDRSTDYPFGGNLSSDVLDLDQDRQTMIMQQLSESIDRSMTLAPGVSADTELPAPESNKLLGWNVSGTALENKSPSSGGIVVASDVSFTPTGTISATNVQDAIAEVAAEAGGGGGVTTFANISAMKSSAIPADGTIVSVAGYYSPQDGGEGQFVYDASGTVNDDGGLFFIPASMPANGRWLRLFQRGQLSVRWYGAKGDGVTNDASAFQSAINTAVSYGAAVRVPPGEYYINATLLVIESGTSDSERKCSIIGDGPAVSRLLFGPGAADGIQFTGVWSGAGMHSYQSCSGLSLERSGNTGNAIRTTNIAFFSLTDVKAVGWSYGLYMADTLSSRIESFISRFNTYGMRAERVSGSDPNAIAMYSCVFGANTEYGVWVIHPANFTMVGGSVEGNGIGGSGGVNNRFGVLVNNAGAEGAVGANFSGVYFENNSGKADVFINATSNSAAHSISGCTFNRISNVNYVVNNIYAEASAASATISVAGCGFKRFGSYVADSGRKYIETNGSANISIAHSGCYFADAVETPTIPNSIGGGGGGATGLDNLAALRAATGYINGDIIEVFGHSIKGDGGGGQFKFDSSLSVADDNGVVIRPSTNPPTGRWVRVAYYEGKPLSVRWYGAKGDGTTDDTSALQATINQGQALIRSVYVPAGTYITQPLTYASTAYAAQVAIIGENSNETIIKKKSGASTDPLLTIGSASATNFTAELRVENITFDGLAKASTTDGIKAYDLVRSSFTSCIFVNSGINFYGLGGIYITFRDCTFDAGNTGARFEKFTSLAGGGWPNGISFENCFLINNSSWGLWFEDGRLVTLDQCEIEGNGTSGNSSTGGVRIGTNIGGEGGGATPNSIGLRARDLWCEANAGAASVVLLGGKNTVENSYFVANANATYDIYINGGTYRLDKCVSDSAKTYNIYEDSGASGPSWINACEMPTLNYNSNKTYIDYGETNRSRFSFHNNGNNYAATSGSATEMTFGSTDFIACGTKSGNGFQSLVNGVYRVNAQVGILAIGNGAYFKIDIYKNGALYKNGVTVANTTGAVAGGQTSISCLVPVSVGDVITARYFMSAAGATVEGSATQSYFQGEKI